MAIFVKPESTLWQTHITHTSTTKETPLEQGRWKSDVVLTELNKKS